MGRFTQGFVGYAFALLVCLGAVGLFLLVTPQSRTERIPEVNFSIDLANARRQASFEVWAPEPVPANWVPNSSRIAPDQAFFTWRLGFATAKRRHAMLAQSDEQPAAEFANRMANSDKPVGTVEIAGATWEKRERPDKNQRTLIRFLDGATVVVTGTADWDELTTLATSLKAYPKVEDTPGPTPSASPSVSASAEAAATPSGGQDG
ncbi:hypothetical protein GCM10010106_32430 [Thermopolyspora flexuosa]|uniref:Uncharacterized protein DUF4245 n=1 Tax=Thermopolyspora flexuosa TaxID=103836 RepID=A0A543ISY1_9ACTN|nr:DUF4245 domain-containing protein [Thermopolyspora flexuosa]TQM73686.1 uncharacterized protein DUF4245 [Thermopolyspora flexuosa]GGM83288.1 hypothetical protein GCM10010106_32430 [Thermopolyspora flexuosa]